MKTVKRNEKQTINYMKNMQSINLKTKTERIGKSNFYPSVIKNSANKLANDLLEYIKKGGDINNLTPNSLCDKEN